MGRPVGRLHSAILAVIRPSLVGVEPAPRIRLEAFLRPELSISDFAHDVALTGPISLWDRLRFVAREPWDLRLMADKPGLHLLKDGQMVAAGYAGLGTVGTVR